MASVNRPVETNRRPWWLLSIEGVIAIILGSILLWAPAKTKEDTWIILVVILGIYLLINGILGLARLFQNQRRWGLKLFSAIISILVGFYILIYPAAVVAALPVIILLVLGIWSCIHGVTRLVTATEGGGWGSAILGVLLIILGIILIVNFANPAFGLVLVYIAGAAILIAGFSLIIRSFREKPSAYQYLY